jgi:hypothetical protein
VSLCWFLWNAALAAGTSVSFGNGGGAQGSD